MATGAAIRARREALGRSLEDVAAATRIPVAHLEAIEADRLEDLPDGPWAAAYVRTLVGHLGIEEASEESAPGEAAVPPAGAPLWLVKAMAGISVVALLAVILGTAVQRLRPDLNAPVVRPEADQHLVVTAKRTTRIAVFVDGEPVLERSVAGGERLEFTAHDRIEIEVGAISDVRLAWNGESVAPQGRQDAPRRLVFVDDGGGP